jgi:hypothetical protein
MGMTAPLPGNPEDNVRSPSASQARVQLGSPLSERSTREIGVLASDVRQLLDIMLDAPSGERDAAWLLMETGYAAALSAGAESPQAL